MIRFGIIGTNWITDEFIRCASQCADFQLTAVYSRTMAKAQEFAAKYGVTECFDNLEAMAASQALDAVYIASPNSLHASQSILFLNNKKHVICEKPAAANCREQQAVIEAARRNNCSYMEAMKTTLQPGLAALKNALPKIGTVRRYNGVYCQYSSRYDLYKSGQNVNIFDPKFASGVLMDLGIYVIYPMIYLFGKPKKIMASCIKLPSGVDGETAVICQYDHMDALLSFSKITASQNPSEILGEAGTLTFSAINEISAVKIHYNDKQTPDEVIYHSENEYFMYYEAQEFINMIKTGRTESSVNSFALLMAVRETMDEIRKQLNLTFPND